MRTKVPFPTSVQFEKVKRKHFISMQDNARLVRDVYAYFPLLMKYTDLHRAQWLKTPSWETDGIYGNVAVIFKIWSLSQHFKREELNYMAQFEEDALTSGGGEMKTGKAAIAERKKKRRDGQVMQSIFFRMLSKLVLNRFSVLYFYGMLFLWIDR
jgi:hypothetical protein